jgi:Uma2 family endonuclease
MFGHADLRPSRRGIYDMGMPDTVDRRTREMVLALPDDGNRYELFDGELLVTPPPTYLHQRTISVLLAVVAPYVKRHALGEVLASPADLQLGGQQLAQPDLFVLPPMPGTGAAEWSAIPNPILVVEILSPSTARHDRLVKRRRYQRTGIPEYWVVDLDGRLVERWRPDDLRPEILAEELAWQPDPARDALRIDLPALFREIWRDPG